MQKWDKNVKMQRIIISLKSALHNYLQLLEQIIFQCYNKVTKRHRLGVRIADSHSVDTGSIPVAAANIYAFRFLRNIPFSDDATGN